jgi:hypothetical protein
MLKYILYNVQLGFWQAALADIQTFEVYIFLGVPRSILFYNLGHNIYTQIFSLAPIDEARELPIAAT